MKVIQTVAGIGAESSGPSYSVPGLCRGLMANGVNVELHTLEPDPHRDFPFRFVCYPADDGMFSVVSPSREMEVGLRRSAHDVDIIHNNGFWEMPNIYGASVIRSLKSKVQGSKHGVPKLVMAPRGCLAPWALNLGKWKKRIFGALFQYPACRAADMWHATCDKEYEEIRTAGYKQPVAIVPIGMEIPDFRVQSSEFRVETSGVVSSQALVVGDQPTNQQTNKPTNVKPTNGLTDQSTNRLKRIAFFGRLHKVKAVDNLVRAWSKLTTNYQKQTTGWELVIAGPDCGARPELERIIAEEKVPRVRFVGEIKGPAKYDFLSQADIYVLPSMTENFGVTLAEALACGVPSIASEGTPWSGLEKEKAGHWVPIGVEPLVDALKDLMSLSDEERRQMGERGREWIRRDFSWEGIGAKMKAAYEWLLNPGAVERPEWVRVD